MRTRWMCFFALLMSLAHATYAGSVPGPGDMPPSYLGHDASGNDVHIEAMRGKVVVITFWASWCGYCLKELPILASIQKLETPTQLQVVAISYKEDYETFRKIRRHLNSYHLLLTYDSDAAISRTYGVHGIPHMVMIGRDGRIAHVHVGYDDAMFNTIASELNALLAEPAPAATHAP